MRLTAAVTKQGTWFVAQCLEVDVASQGKTPDEAIANLQEALELRFEGEDPADVAEPAVIAPIDLKRSA